MVVPEREHKKVVKKGSFVSSNTKFRQPSKAAVSSTPTPSSESTSTSTSTNTANSKVGVKRTTIGSFLQLDSKIYVATHVGGEIISSISEPSDSEEEGDGVATPASLSLEVGETIYTTIAPEETPPPATSSPTPAPEDNISDTDVSNEVHKQYGLKFADLIQSQVREADQKKLFDMRHRKRYESCVQKFIAINGIKYEIVIANTRVLVAIGGSREDPKYLSVFRLNRSVLIATHSKARVNPDIADVALTIKSFGV
jgi:hypothetical protein